MADVAVTVLSLLSPANAMLQGKRCNLSTATRLISNTREAIEALRTNEQYAEFDTKAGIPRAAKVDKPRRNLTQTKLLQGFLVSTTLGQQGSALKSASQWHEKKQTYFSLLDGVTGEIGARFG